MRLFAVASLAATISFGQEPARRDRPSIRTTGEATVSAKPDQAKIDIGVVTQAATAAAAASQNAQQLDAVMNQLRRVLGSNADIRTISYSVNPNYRYPREGGQPTITGYLATNIVQVTLNDLAAVGKVIDTATQSGANNVQRLQFTLKDEQAARSQALKQAAAQARAAAEAIAASLGVKIVGVLHAEEGAPSVIRPMRAMAADMAQVGRAPTPIESGTVDVHAMVTLEMEIAR